MIAVLIHAHKNEAQLYKLISALQHPEIKIFLHLDKKCPFKITYPGLINIENPITIDWASFSQVRALLHSFEQIKSCSINFDFVHFISGLDFPVKPVNRFVDFLNENKGFSFIETLSIPAQWPGAAVRYQRFYFTEKYELNRQLGPFLKLLSLVYKRKPPVKIFGGSQWFTLSGGAVDYILKYVKQETAFFNFIKHCDVADELFVHTILLNSPLKLKCINNNLRLISWANAEKGLGDSPDVLRVHHFEKIKSSSQFFARKFDEEMDAQILTKITAELLTS